MATPVEDTLLSRAISEIDLTAALRNIKSKPGGSTKKSSTEQILSFQTGAENDPDNPTEFEYIPKSSLHEVVTPPYLAYPLVPPTTPATPGSALEVAQFSEPTIVKEVPVAHAGDTASKKKKKKSRSSGKNKKPSPTGFEEFYCDPPITPEEHDEELWLYGQAYPFEERIQTCIQRYRARRKLDGVRSNIFTKYLMLGGVEATTKAFTGGLDKEIIENSTAAEIAAIQATDYVRKGPSLNSRFYNGSKDWVVDFEGVAKGFFSHYIPKKFTIQDEKQLQGYVAVIRNFLNYILLHAVCPEYTEDVMAARKICDLAEKELWVIEKLGRKLPGEFNVAASTIYGGHWKPNDDIQSCTWDAGDPFEGITGITRGLGMADAERIFKTSVCLVSTDDELFDEVCKPNVCIVKSEYKAYEVVAIERASLELFAQYKSVKDAHGVAGTIKALGVIRFKPWEGARIQEIEQTDEERAKMDNGDSNIDSFWLEDEILELCFIGLKMEVVVHELNFGFKFFDTITGIYCSFYTYLHNEKMAHWKEPWPSTKPPPTEDDPDVEERALTAEASEEL